MYCSYIKQNLLKRLNLISIFVFGFNFCRYSDFIVNEVDLDGNVVHLTSLVAPAEV